VLTLLLWNTRPVILNVEPVIIGERADTNGYCLPPIFDGVPEKIFKKVLATVTICFEMEIIYYFHGSTLSLNRLPTSLNDLPC